ncbi:hypothetical protein [Streptomyces sp. NPDC054842]
MGDLAVVALPVAPPYTGAALRVMRTAAGRRALQLGVLVGGLSALGFIGGGQAHAADAASPVAPAGVVRSVQGPFPLTSPRDGVESAGDAVVRAVGNVLGEPARTPVTPVHRPAPSTVPGVRAAAPATPARHRDAATTATSRQSTNLSTPAVTVTVPVPVERPEHRTTGSAARWSGDRPTNPAPDAPALSATDRTRRPATDGVLRPVTEGVLRPVTEGVLRPVTEGVLRPVTDGIRRSTTSVATPPVQTPPAQTPPATDTAPPVSDATQPAPDDVLQPVTDVLQPVTDALSPATDLPQPATGALQPATDVLQPVTAALPPTADVLQPVTGVLQPVTGVLQPVTGVLQPVTGVVQPVGDLVGDVVGNVVGGLGEVSAELPVWPEGPSGPSVPGLPQLPGLPVLPETPELPGVPGADQVLPAPAPACPQDSGADAARPNPVEHADGVSAGPAVAYGPRAGTAGAGAAGREGQVSRRYADGVRTVPVPSHRAPDGDPAHALTNGSAADGGAPRHGDAHAVTSDLRAPWRLVPGASEAGVVSGTRDRQREIPEFPG